MSQNPELVSVTVRAYNRAYILKQTIESILRSTYANIEVIVVDDGSTDNTRELMKGFTDPRVRYIVHETNRGASAAVDTGVRASRGDFVAVCDSDDHFLPEKIQKSVDRLKSLPARYGMVASNHYDALPDGTKKIGITEKNHARIFPMPSTWVIRREVFDKIGSFDPRLWAGEDTEFWARFRSRYDFYFIEEPLVIKTASPDHFFANKEKLLKWRKLSAENVKGETRLYAFMLFIYAKDLWKCGYKTEARQNFFRAFLADPLRPVYLTRYLSSIFQPDKGMVWAE